MRSPVSGSSLYFWLSELLCATRTQDSGKPLKHLATLLTVCATMSYSHRRSPSVVSIDYDSDASSSSRRSPQAKRQYAMYAEPHRRNSSRSQRPANILFRNDLYIEQAEEEVDHGHGYPQEAASSITASSVMHRITRLFKSHRRAVIVLGLFFIASSTLHFLNQPYVDVTQARHILDDALKWSGQRVGLRRGSRNSHQPPDCHFRSTVEGTP